MKKIVILLIVFALLACACPAYACTGFAVYGDTPIYGMNFDYPLTEVRLAIDQNSSIAYFAMEFEQEDGFVSTVGMNGQGLFSTLQMQYPEAAGRQERGGDELFVPELLYMIGEYATVDDLMRSVGDRRLLQWSGVTLHSLLADPTGSALIAEAGDTQNEIMPMEGNFIVMTNFTNADFRDTPYDQINGVGAGRYITACEYIQENQDGFGIDEALACLQATTQEGGYPTLCSMAFAPEEQCVYVALHRDFDAIWKISIPGKTIETYRGFDEQLTFKIPDDGVLASDLMHGSYDKYDPVQEPEEIGTEETSAQAGEVPAEDAAADNAAGQSQGLMYVAIVLAAAAIAASSMVMQKKRREAQDRRPRRRL
jgi:hypothetical protein